MNEPSDPIRILIADDHPMMRGGLRTYIQQEPDMVVVAEASNGQEAVELYHLTRPDVSLLDLQMPVMDGLQAIAEIRRAVPNAPVVVLTTYPGDARVARALALGVTSYILKTARSDELVATLRNAYLGRTHLAVEAQRDLLAHQGLEKLNARELDVLQLAAQGNSNRAIGDALHISEETVKTRMKNILAKLHAQDRTHAVTIALRRGFIDP